MLFPAFFYYLPPVSEVFPELHRQLNKHFRKVDILQNLTASPNIVKLISLF